MFAVKHDEGWKWYYLVDQSYDDQMFRFGQVARLTPHTAFLDKTSPNDAPQRQRIEVRCLVFDRV